jgi:hypothetical protein
MRLQEPLRWIATPLGLALGCALGLWLYMSLAWPIGFGAALRCLFSGAAPDTCTTLSEQVRFWVWTVTSGILAGSLSVLLAVTAAPRSRNIVRIVAIIVPPLCWLVLGSWNFYDTALWALVLTSITGGLLAAWLLGRVHRRSVHT